MTAARDVVAYIEERRPDASPIELCKLAYYAQAWHIAWEGMPLFTDRIEAWKHGPVPVRWWRERDRGVTPRPDQLSAAERDVVDAVLAFYGRLSASALRSLSHDEQPWKDARGDLPEDAPSNEEITVASIRRYYARKAMSGSSVPRRPSRNLEMSVERALALAEVEAPRWRRTLSRLAVR